MEGHNEVDQPVIGMQVYSVSAVEEDRKIRLLR